jgi:hypothetical protein
MNSPLVLATGTIIEDDRAGISGEVSMIISPGQGAGYGSLAADLRRTSLT